MKLKHLIERHSRLINKLNKLDNWPIPLIFEYEAEIIVVQNLIDEHKVNMSALSGIRDAYFRSLQHSSGHWWGRARVTFREVLWDGCIESTRHFLGLKDRLDDLYAKCKGDEHSRLVVHTLRLMILQDYKTILGYIEHYFAHCTNYTVDTHFSALPDIKILLEAYRAESLSIEQDYDRLSQTYPELPNRRKTACFHFFPSKPQLGIQLSTFSQRVKLNPFELFSLLSNLEPEKKVTSAPPSSAAKSEPIWTLVI